MGRRLRLFEMTQRQGATCESSNVVLRASCPWIWLLHDPVVTGMPLHLINRYGMSDRDWCNWHSENDQP
jgi:hypothetical protein